MDLIDPQRDQVLADGRLVGVGEQTVDLVVGSGRDPLEHLVGVVIASLDAFEVEDGKTAEAGQHAREPGIDHRVHRRREDRHAQLETREGLREIDVGGLDRLRPGCQRDVLEPVRRPDRVDLRAEDASARGRRRLVDSGGFGAVQQRAPPRARLTR